MTENARFHVDMLQLFRTNTRRQLLPRRSVEPGRCQMFSRNADLVPVEGGVLRMEGSQLAQKPGLASNVALRSLRPPKHSGKLGRSQ